MQYVHIDGIDKPLSKLAFGTSRRDAGMAGMIPLLDEYIQLGGNVIDTAMHYNSGESEKTVGEWMASRGNREKLFLLTKGCHPTPDEPNRVTPEIITKDLTGSLERLGVDQVDLYLLHRDDPSLPVGVLVDKLNEHIDAGRIKRIGVSNWTWQRIEEANEYADKHGLQGFVISSVNLSLAKPLQPLWPGCISVDEETWQWHKRTGFPMLSWSAQARGFFSGNYRQDDPSDPYMVETYYSDDNWERYRRANELAERKGVPVSQIVLAYVFNQPFPVVGAVGSFTSEELRNNAQAADLELSTAEVEWLDLQSDERPF